MPLGGRSDLHSRLAEVEKYGFNRGLFPWSYNDHSVIVVLNDGYIADDGRLFLHLSLECALCELESVNRGKLSIDEHLHNRVQTVKMLTLRPYHENECS